jgi:hypothetical protein
MIQKMYKCSYLCYQDGGYTQAITFVVIEKDLVICKTFLLLQEKFNLSIFGNIIFCVFFCK